MKIPFFDLSRQYQSLRPQLSVKIDRLLKSGSLILGKEVELFEKKFADFIGVKYAVGVNSGTDALKISLRALGIGSGDKVITAANTAVPTVSAIRETGALPEFVDIKDDYLLNESKLEKKISSRTKAIIPVHLYGNVCQMDKICRICRKYKLKIIEDCAQAHGAEFKKKKAGSFGDLSCFSFYPTKNLGAAGDAGIILTNSSLLSEKCRQLRMYGMKDVYRSEREGFNSRLDELQAGILNVKIAHLTEWNDKRRLIADFYMRNIRNKLVKFPVINKNIYHVFHLFVVRCSVRKKLISYLVKNKIGFKIHYPDPIHLQKGYQFLNYKKGDLPETEKTSREIISLPLFPEMTEKERTYVVRKINAF